MWCVGTHRKKRTETLTRSLTLISIRLLLYSLIAISQVDQQLKLLCAAYTPKCCGSISIFPTSNNYMSIQCFTWSIHTHTCTLPPPSKISIQWLSTAAQFRIVSQLSSLIQISSVKKQFHFIYSLNFYYYSHFYCHFAVVVWNYNAVVWALVFSQITNDLHSFIWVHISAQMSVVVCCVYAHRIHSEHR